MRIRVLAAGVVAITIVLVAVTIASPTAGAVMAVVAWLVASVTLVGRIRSSRIAAGRSAATEARLREQLAARERDAIAAPAARQPGPVVEEQSEWSRGEILGESFTQRPIAEFVTRSEPVAWSSANPYLDRSESEVLELIGSEVRWRYHHGIPSIEQTVDYYAAYARRVDAMLEMLDTALTRAGVDVPGSSFLDLGAAEGYVVNHLLDGGATDVDAVELNAGNIQRMWMVRALKHQYAGRIGRLDLDRTDWSAALGRTYDVTLALGVIYHMESPMLFARHLYESTTGVAVVESDTPSFPANQRFRGYGNIYLHRDQVTLRQGEVRQLMEMRPDRQALAEILLTAGFQSVHAIPAATANPDRYFDSGEKSMLLAVR